MKTAFLRVRSSKTYQFLVPPVPPEDSGQILHVADQLRQRIPADHYDFDAAKAAVVAATAF